jgi:hypothetical protein
MDVDNNKNSDESDFTTINLYSNHIQMALQIWTGQMILFLNCH